MKIWQVFLDIQYHLCLHSNHQNTAVLWIRIRISKIRIRIRIFDVLIHNIPTEVIFISILSNIKVSIYIVCIFKAGPWISIFVRYVQGV